MELISLPNLTSYDKFTYKSGLNMEPQRKIGEAATPTATKKKKNKQTAQN